MPLVSSRSSFSVLSNDGALPARRRPRRKRSSSPASAASLPLGALTELRPWFAISDGYFSPVVVSFSLVFVSWALLLFVGPLDVFLSLWGGLADLAAMVSAIAANSPMANSVILFWEATGRALLISVNNAYAACADLWGNPPELAAMVSAIPATFRRANSVFRFGEASSLAPLTLVIRAKAVFADLCLALSLWFPSWPRIPVVVPSRQNKMIWVNLCPFFFKEVCSLNFNYVARSLFSSGIFRTIFAHLAGPVGRLAVMSYHIGGAFLRPALGFVMLFGLAYAQAGFEKQGSHRWFGNPICSLLCSNQATDADSSMQSESSSSSGPYHNFVVNDIPSLAGNGGIPARPSSNTNKGNSDDGDSPSENILTSSAPDDTNDLLRLLLLSAAQGSTVGLKEHASVVPLTPRSYVHHEIVRSPAIARLAPTQELYVLKSFSVNERVTDLSSRFGNVSAWSLVRHSSQVFAVPGPLKADFDFIVAHFEQHALRVPLSAAMDAFWGDIFSGAPLSSLAISSSSSVAHSSRGLDAPSTSSVRPLANISIPAPILPSALSSASLTTEASSSSSSSVAGRRSRTRSRRSARKGPKEPKLDPNDLFFAFTARGKFIHSPERPTRRPSQNYLSGTPSFQDSGKSFELFCQKIWSETVSYDRGMRTFIDIVLSRVGPELEAKLAPICVGHGPYIDSRNHISIPDLGMITPVQWVRLATPIVEGDRIGVVRRAQAELCKQTTQSFKNFHSILARAYLVVAIHMDWTISQMRQAILDRFPLVLNDRNVKTLVRQFGGTLRAEDYETIVDTLDKEDSLKTMAAVVGDNPYTLMLDADTGVRTVVGKASKRSAAEAQLSKADVKKMRLELESIRTLLNKADGSGSSAAPSTLLVKKQPQPSKSAPPKCRHCQKSHKWKEEHCFKGNGGRQRYEASLRTQVPSTSSSSSSGSSSAKAQPASGVTEIS